MDICRGSIPLARANIKIGVIMIVKTSKGWVVKSKDGKRKLGGPYKTKAEAKKRLAQVERFSHRK